MPKPWILIYHWSLSWSNRSRGRRGYAFRCQLSRRSGGPCRLTRRFLLGPSAGQESASEGSDMPEGTAASSSREAGGLPGQPRVRTGWRDAADQASGKTCGGTRAGAGASSAGLRRPDQVSSSEGPNLAMSKARARCGNHPSVVVSSKQFPSSLERVHGAGGQPPNGRKSQGQGMAQMPASPSGSSFCPR